MELNIQNSSGEKAGTVTVPDVVFGARMNGDLVWQVATAQMSNKRQVLAHAKTRSEVRGGGKKPWRQKGTGRARHGSIRSPIWIGGGVAHGPSRDANFKKIVTKSTSRKALAVVLSARLKDGGLLVVDTLGLATGKTKDGAKAMTALTKGFSGYRPESRVLVVLPGGKDDAMARRALANLNYIQTMRAQDLNALAVLSFPFVLATRDAVGVIEKILSSKKK